MKTILKTILVAVSAAILTSGCAVKHNDSLPEKVIKHTVTAPLYALYTLGSVTSKVVDLAAMSTVIVVTKTGKATVKTIEKIGATK